MTGSTKLRLRFKRPRITANLTVTGAIGDVIRISYTVSGLGADANLSGPSAALFQVDGTYVTLLDSSVAGVYSVSLGAVDDRGRQAIPVLLTFTVTPAASLPILVLTTSAFDAHTIQCIFTSDAGYSSYQYVVDADFGHILNLAANKQIAVVRSGQGYDVQVRGVTAGGQQGPWSNVSHVVLPFATMVLVATTVDQDTVQLNFSDDATYIRYQAQWKTGAGSYGAPIDLDGTKRINGLTPSTTYTAQIRGSTT